MTQTIKPFDDGKGNGFTHPDKALKELLEYKPTKPEEPVEEVEKAVPEHAKITIEDMETLYRIRNVGEKGSFDALLDKSLLDDGKRHLQETWLDLRRRHNDWHVPDTIDYFTLMQSLYHNRDHPDEEQLKLVEKVRDMLADDFDDRFMMTSTSAYLDELTKLEMVSRDPALAAENVKWMGKSDFIGRSDAVCDFEDLLEKLLGCSDPLEVKRVFEWISGKDAYLWCAEKCDKKAPVLIGGTDFCFGMCIDPKYDAPRSARGLVIVYN